MIKEYVKHVYHFGSRVKYTGRISAKLSLELFGAMDRLDRSEITVFQNAAVTLSFQ